MKKTRTMASVIAIVISTILLIGYGSIISTFIDGLDNFNYINISGIKSSGYFETDVEDSELQNKLETEYGDIAVKKDYSKVKINDDRFDEKYNTLVSFDDKYLNASAITLVKGQAPSKDNEIILPSSYEEYYNKYISIKLETDGVSETLKFKVSGVYAVSNGNSNFRNIIISSTSNLFQPNAIQFYLVSNDYDEVINDKVLKEFKHTEFVENPYKSMNKSLYLNCSLAALSLLVFVVLRNINEIFNQLDVEESKRLSYVGINKHKKIISNCIYTIYICTLPIILGIILGSIIYKQFMPLILSFTDFSSITKMEVNINLICLVVILVYVLFFITLSTSRKNIKHVGKINSIRKIKKGLPIELYSKKSIQMNKRKYYSIIVTLTISFSLLLIVIISTLSLNPTAHAKNNNIYDIQIKGNLSENGFDTLPIKDMELHKYLDKVDVDNNYLLYQKTETGLQSLIDVKVNKKIESENSVIDLGESTYLMKIAGLSEGYYEYIAKKYDIQGSKELGNSGLIYFRANDTADNIEVGDRVELQFYNGSKTIKIEEKVVTIVQDLEGDKYDVNLGTFNLSSKYFAKLFGTDNLNMIGISCKSNHGCDGTLTEIESLASIEQEYDVQTYSSYIKTIQSFRVFLVSFGLIGAVLLFINSILNIVCTQIANNISREVELATLEAIGCPKRKIVRILENESLYYLIRSYSISFILIAASLMFIKSEIAFSENWIFIFIVCFFILSAMLFYVNKVVITTNFNKISKRGITERIKKE